NRLGFAYQFAFLRLFNRLPAAAALEVFENWSLLERSSDLIDWNIRFLRSDKTILVAKSPFRTSARQSLYSQPSLAISLAFTNRPGVLLEELAVALSLRRP